MSGAVIAVIAHSILGASLIIDKFILGHRVKGNSITFVFWLGIANGIFLPFFFFGFEAPSLSTGILGVLAGGLLLVASRFLFGALERGEVTEAPTVVGAFTAIATALWSSVFLEDSLNTAEKMAFGLLVLGGLLMFLSERVARKRVVPWVIAASIFYGIANVFQKLVFSSANFITGLMLLSLGTVLGASMLLLRKKWRHQILTRSEKTPVTRRFLYFGNRVLAGGGTLLALYAIKLDHPALVDAISGVRAVVVFALIFVIAKLKPHLFAEHMKGRELAGKLVATALIIIGLLGLGFQRYYENQPLPHVSSLTWGTTFSERAARELGLDPEETYRSILSELRPDVIRLVAYWDLVEPEPKQFDFSSLDWQMNESAKAGIPVVLAIGQKVPRWPECHYPRWLEVKNDNVRNEKLIEYLAVLAERYREHPALAYWQIENEPYLPFGECPPFDESMFEKELTLVKRLDGRHPILLTDGGEFGTWYQVARRGDVFGTTLYRKVHNKVFGYITYPVTPQFFQLKKSVVQFLTKKPEQKFIVIELGLEPWGEKQIYETPLEEQFRLFSFDEFKTTVEFAKQARFDTYYAWGAEWWYWLKTKHNDSRFWDFAKETFHEK
ncbi:hypothetical protein C4571_03940 [Candidatus Parcubacteria bacterium]|nr:MAG: hypothetical protein C4571_03940 [Candidatus Parcubacteria bacterium]